MKLLVTTSKALIVVDYNGADSKVEILHEGRGAYYGVTELEGNYFVTARDDKLPRTMVTSENGVLLKFDGNFNYVGESSPDHFNMRGLHGVVSWKGSIVCAITHSDCLGVFDGKTWGSWQSIEKVRPDDPDNYHINTLVVKDDVLLQLSKSVFDSTLDCINEYSELYGPSIKTHEPYGTYTHDIWFEDGAIWSIEFQSSSVVSNRGDRIKLDQGLTRGITITDDSYYVGVSAPSHRQSRHNTTGKILRFDKNWVLLDQYVMESGGQVHEIKPYTVSK